MSNFIYQFDKMLSWIVFDFLGVLSGADQRAVFTAVKRSFAIVKKERTHGDICDDWNDGSRQNGLCGRWNLLQPVV